MNKIQTIKLRKIHPARFPSEALKEIASWNRKGNSKKPLRFFL